MFLLVGVLDPRLRNCPRRKDTGSSRTMTPIQGRMGKKYPKISHLLPFSLWQCFPLIGPAGNPRTPGSEDAAIGVRPLWHRADRGCGEGMGVEAERYESD